MSDKEIPADLAHALEVCEQHGLTTRNVRVRYNQGKRGDDLLAPKLTRRQAAKRSPWSKWKGN